MGLKTLYYWIYSTNHVVVCAIHVVVCINHDVVCKNHAVNEGIDIVKQHYL